VESPERSITISTRLFFDGSFLPWAGGSTVRFPSALLFHKSAKYVLSPKPAPDKARKRLDPAVFWHVPGPRSAVEMAGVLIDKLWQIIKTMTHPVCEGAPLREVNFSPDGQRRLVVSPVRV